MLRISIQRQQEVQVRFWKRRRACQTSSNKTATRHFHFPSSCTFSSIMSDNKKQEKDFTPEVDALLPEAESLVKVCSTTTLRSHEQG